MSDDGIDIRFDDSVPEPVRSCFAQGIQNALVGRAIVVSVTRGGEPDGLLVHLNGLTRKSQAVVIFFPHASTLQALDVWRILHSAIAGAGGS